MMPPRDQAAWWVVFFGISAFFFAPFSARAERVEKVSSDGSLILNGGEKVRLAGVELSPESIRVLSLLLAGTEVQLEIELQVPRSSLDSPLPVYLFVKTKEIKFPFSELLPTREKRLMINELLLSWGGGRVPQELKFRRRERFLEIEAQARRKGEGIWSYETPGRTNGVDDSESLGG